MKTVCLLAAAVVAASSVSVLAEDTVTVRPREIDDVLTNPGIGFTTFQRFNGDRLNEGLEWTEGFPINYQPFSGRLTNQNHPLTSIAYFRVYWKFLEPASGVYRWDLLDKALATARERGQTLMLRIAPYGTGPDTDVPAWYRALVAGSDWEKNVPVEKWRVHPENPLYLKHFGKLIRELGARYDGCQDLELAWLPGDNLFDSFVTVPAKLPPGQYDLAIALVDPKTKEPKVNLAIAGKAQDGWYRLGTVALQKTRVVGGPNASGH